MTLWFQKWHEELVNFHRSTQKSKKLYFDGLFWSKASNVSASFHLILMRAVASLKTCTLMCYFCRNYIMFEPKKCRGVMCHYTEEWCKIWGRTNLCFEKWHKEFGKFWPNTRKSQNLHFNRLLLTKVYNVWAEKLQRSYVLWHWRVMQYLKKNWLVVWKITIGIWLIFMRAVASLKICTLMGSFCPKHITF